VHTKALRAHQNLFVGERETERAIGASLFPFPLLPPFGAMRFHALEHSRQAGFSWIISSLLYVIYHFPNTLIKFLLCSIFYSQRSFYLDYIRQMRGVASFSGSSGIGGYFPPINHGVFWVLERMSSDYLCSVYTCYSLVLCVGILDS